MHGVIWIDLKEVKAEGVRNELLESAYRKLKQSEGLEGYERRAIENFTDAFVTVTRCVTIVGEEAVRIAEEVNWHSHSSSCKKVAEEHAGGNSHAGHLLAPSLWTPTGKMRLQEWTPKRGRASWTQ